MAAPVRIEDEAFSDERYVVLATACQLADADHARGKMARLWRQCTAQGVYVLPASVCNAVLGANGAAGLCESGLGEPHEDGIRIRGTRGRIEWLKKLRNNAKKGGKAKAAKRQTSGNPDGRAEAARRSPPPFPPTPTPTPTPVLTLTPDPTQNSEKNSTSPSARAPREPSGPHQLSIAAFTGYYGRTHGGAKPTWEGKNSALMARLVKAHGLDEIKRRLEILEHAPPKFPAPPWDMPTFSQHFDNIAVPNHGRPETALDVALRLANGGQS